MHACVLCRSKFSGTALTVSTQPSTDTQYQVAALGVTQPYWQVPTAVYAAQGDAPAVFYISISPDYAHTVQPNTRLGIVSTPKYLSLSPVMSPNASFPFTPLNYTTLTIDFICTNSEDGGAVNVTLFNDPFAPTWFVFFKQCRECQSHRD